MTLLVAGKDAIVAELRREKYVNLAALHGFEILAGDARFIQGPALEVNGKRIEAAHYVIATGSSASAPSIPGLDAIDYLTSSTSMALDHVPTSLVVIGANAIGLEQGQLFARLGAKVTIVEALERIAPFEEPEIAEALAGILLDEGVSIRAGARVLGMKDAGDSVITSLATATGREELHSEAVLVATGRSPATAELGLELVGVRLGERGEVVVDEQLRTTNPRIFAAGDVTGHPQFVYVAGRHGAVVADNALNGAHGGVDYRTMPRVTFTSPAIASVGITDAQARSLGIECECRVLPFTHVPRAIVNLDTRGVAKVDRVMGRVLGVHLLAVGAGDAILAAVYALDADFTVE